MNAPLHATRYARLADELASCIHAGTLRAGDKLPSVRTLCALHDASPATVTHALHLLEDAGLIEARPRAGFFVKRRAPEREAPTQCNTELGLPQQVEICAKRRRMLDFCQQGGGDRLALATLSPSLFPTHQLQKLMTYHARRDPSLLARYGLDAGEEALRRQIARRGVEAGCLWQADEIVVTHGNIEAISLCLREMTRPGDVVAISSPCNANFLHTMESLELRALEIPAHPCNGVSAEALAFALSQQKIAACLLTANFAPPTGSLMSDAAKRRIVELLAEHDVPLIEDDTFGDFYSGEQRPKPFKAFDTHGNVTLCADLSMTLAPGLGLGYIVAGKYRTALESRRLGLGESVSLLMQRTYAAFLESGHYEPHLRRLRRNMAEQVAALRAAVCEYFPCDSRVSCTDGGYMLWVELPRGIDTSELQERARAEGCGFAPGELFSLGDTFRNCLRLNAGYPFTPEIESAIRRLGELAQSMLVEQAA
ncbi:PLP-dependent aminotransferase family protein [Chitinivorax sp. PXF-14]|uniref:aminotransferase-like domain-containing protein n=1 Tax=Chitinivorax sp. PXF-14 TaxID=3230488 RepID=UPI0034673A1B